MRLVLTIEGRPEVAPHVVAKGAVQRAGRAAESGIVLKDVTVGKRHAVFDFSKDRCTVARDPDISPSAGDIYVNGWK